MSAAEQPPYCAECGLHSPCKTCGGGARPRLGLVPQPTERLYTRAEAEALMLKAWNLGHLNASASDEAYPPKVQRPIDIDFVFRSDP